MRPYERLQRLRPIPPDPPLRAPRFSTSCLYELVAFGAFAVFCVVAALIIWAAS
jgi:hypothetical protein